MSQDLGLPVRAVEETLLGAERTLTRTQVADRAGVPLELAEELGQQLGLPHAADDYVAFSEADVVALALAHDLIGLGVLTPDRRSALVRTWGRSFARLAEWQVGLIARLTALTDTAPTPRTRSRRSVPGSRTARSWAGSVTCSGRPSTSPPA